MEANRANQAQRIQERKIKPREDCTIMKKEERRAKAIQKNKRKKTLILAACISVAAILVALIAFSLVQQSNVRVFGDGYQTFTLRRNGTFTAQLYHDAAKNGTYTEHEEDGITIVSFTHDGKTEHGSIVNNILTIPDEWDDGHGHGTSFLMR